MRFNTESIFTKMHLLKSKPLIVGILYSSPPDKIDYVNCMEQVNTVRKKPGSVTSLGTLK